MNSTWICPFATSRTIPIQTLLGAKHGDKNMGTGTPFLR
ncbi:hypothetical protein SpAn4DRAFT_3344 [Sporomusa ovata]|uniref:Uncharacterized protein n=1 Tax=Sporomusa ovata TaxID=2378 RepID=A0A0U1L1V4_9FIRM|nr:hypothetical protein SpAn4DRAFT_3344 [Sporomusa ovata]